MPECVRERPDEIDHSPGIDHSASLPTHVESVTDSGRVEHGALLEHRTVDGSDPMFGPSSHAPTQQPDGRTDGRPQTDAAADAVQQRGQPESSQPASLAHLASPGPASTSASPPPGGASNRRVPPGVSATTDYLRLGAPYTSLPGLALSRKPIAGATALSSPCFVHSHLDTTLASFVASEEKKRARAAKDRSHGAPPDTSSGSETDTEGSDDPQTLTRQLAETAVSVREMSKQLGRARVKTSIQSIMIITKAKDPQLVKLTRELAIHLMRHGKGVGRDRGAIVYVDAQLERSKRFNAAGIQKDFPDFFRPIHSLSSRRSSRHNSTTHLAGGSDGGMDRDKRIASLRQQLASTPVTSPPSMPSRRHTDSAASSGAATPNGDKANDEGQLRYWTAEMCTRAPHLFDFVVTLGGDGTVLFASWLFQRVVPPIIPFALGSLGFLTNFDFANYDNVLSAAIKEGVRVNLRMRFTCTVYRAIESDGRKAIRSGKTGEIFMTDMDKHGWEAIEGSLNKSQRQDSDRAPSRDREVRCFSTHPVESFEVLNDLVVDRGPSPYVSLLELFGDEHHMTTVQADGLCVATPTGSTAYSLSAGGSLVHPEIPAILISPICPHTLSFRPMLLPDSMELRICVPFNSRSTAWASFDGRGRVELKQGDHIKVTASQYPFPTVCADKQSTDWFHAIGRTLKWNERQRQRSFVVIEEPRQREKSELKAVETDREKAERNYQSPEKARSFRTNASVGGGSGEDDDQNTDDDDDDETVDIDDLSSLSSFSDQARAASNRTHGLVDPSDADDDSETRFADERPRPPRLSERHSFHSRGDNGDRDDLRMPLEHKVKSPKRSNQQRKIRFDAETNGKSETTSQTAAKAPRADEIRVKQHMLQDYAHELQRAFAVVGDDYSDASLSDAD